MDHTGIRILFEGSNGLRLLSGLWTTVEISLLSVIGSVIFGLFTGLFMTLQNREAKLISRFYLEFIRIMPQLVLLFIAYFGITRAFDINLSGFAASVIVFILWGTAEMGDLVRGALISIPKNQYESAEALGLSRRQMYRFIIIPQSLRRLLPPAINLFTRIIKTTSLVVLIGVVEMLKTGQQRQKIPQRFGKITLAKIGGHQHDIAGLSVGKNLAAAHVGVSVLKSAGQG